MTLAEVLRVATRELSRQQAAFAPGNVVDLFFASSGIEPEVVERSEPIEVLPDVIVPVAQVGDLIALKLLARDDAERPQEVGQRGGAPLVLRRRAAAAGMSLQEYLLDHLEWFVLAGACQLLTPCGSATKGMPRPWEPCS